MKKKRNLINRKILVFGLCGFGLIPASVILSTSQTTYNLVQNTKSLAKSIASAPKAITELTGSSGVLAKNYQTKNSVDLNWTEKETATVDLGLDNQNYRNQKITTENIKSKIDSKINSSFFFSDTLFPQLEIVEPDEIGWYTSSADTKPKIIEWKSQTPTTRVLNSSSFNLEQGSFYETGYKGLKIMLGSFVSYNNGGAQSLREGKSIWDNPNTDPRFPAKYFTNITDLLTQNAKNLNPTQDIYLWFKQNNQKYDSYRFSFGAQGRFEENYSYPSSVKESIEFLGISNNPKEHTNEILDKTTKRTSNCGSWHGCTTETWTNIEAKDGLKFYIKLNKNYSLRYINNSDRVMIVSDLITNARKTDLDFGSKLWTKDEAGDQKVNSSIVANPSKNKTFKFFTNTKDYNVSTSNFDINFNIPDFTYDSKKYHFENKQISIPQYKDFKLNNVIVPKTNETFNNTKNDVYIMNGVLVNQNPTLGFKFNPAFDNLLINIQNLVNQYKWLNSLRDEYTIQAYYQSLINQVLQQIKSKQVSYEEVKKFTDTFKVDYETNELGMDITKAPEIKFGYAKWYDDAVKQFSFQLPNAYEVSDWKYFLELVSHYFSQDITADVNLGDIETKENQIVWNSKTWNFETISNTINQIDNLQVQNKSKIELANFGFKPIDNVETDRKQNITNELPSDLRTPNAGKLLDTSTIEVQNQKLVYEYPYRKNYKYVDVSDLPSSVSQRKTRAIIYQDPDYENRYADFYDRLSANNDIVQNSVNQYLNLLSIKVHNKNTNGVYTLAPIPIYHLNNPSYSSIKAEVEKIASQYNLDLTTDNKSGKFWYVITIGNANDLGDKQRLQEAGYPLKYMYYIPNQDYGASSMYLVQFEAQTKQYEANDITFNNAGEMFVKNKSEDGIFWYNQNPELNFDTTSFDVDGNLTDWNNLITTDINNQTITLTAKNDSFVAFGNYSALNQEFTNEVGTLSIDKTNEFLKMLKAKTNKVVNVNDLISYVGTPDDITFTLNINNVLDIISTNQTPTLVNFDGGLGSVLKTITKTKATNELQEISVRVIINPQSGYYIDLKLPYRVKVVHSGTQIVNGTSYETKTINVEIDYLSLDEFDYINSGLYLFTEQPNNNVAKLREDFVKNFAEILKQDLGYQSVSYDMSNYQSQIVLQTDLVNSLKTKRISPVLSFSSITNTVMGGGANAPSTEKSSTSAVMGLGLGLGLGMPLTLLAVALIVFVIKKRNRNKQLYGDKKIK